MSSELVLILCYSSGLPETKMWHVQNFPPSRGCRIYLVWKTSEALVMLNRMSQKQWLQNSSMKTVRETSNLLKVRHVLKDLVKSGLMRNYHYNIKTTCSWKNERPILQNSDVSQGLNFAKEQLCVFVWLLVLRRSFINLWPGLYEGIICDSRGLDSVFQGLPVLCRPKVLIQLIRQKIQIESLKPGLRFTKVQSCCNLGFWLTQGQENCEGAKFKTILAPGQNGKI